MQHNYTSTFRTFFFLVLLPCYIFKFGFDSKKYHVNCIIMIDLNFYKSGSFIYMDTKSFFLLFPLKFIYMWNVSCIGQKAEKRINTQLLPNQRNLFILVGCLWTQISHPQKSKTPWLTPKKQKIKKIMANKSTNPFSLSSPFSKL